MAEGQEQQETTQEDEEERQAEEREQTAFDANPPVDPTEPQVGNSRARFFMPRDEGSDADSDEDENERDEDEGGEEAAGRDDGEDAS
jgi:hypothetical protein